MNKVQAACGFLMIATVSACGSSNSNVGRGTVVPFDLPNTGSADAITANTLNAGLNSLKVLDADIAGGRVLAPTIAPTGQAQLNGYVGIRLDPVDVIVGDLVINANFDSGRVTSTASRFAQFEIEVVNEDRVATAASTLGEIGETLTGTGIIEGSRMTSTLDGVLTTTGGSAEDLEVEVNLGGSIYDNGADLLVIRGFLTGTVDELPVISGEFVVLEPEAPAAPE